MKTIGFLIILFSLTTAHSTEKITDNNFFKKIADVIFKINTGKILSSPQKECNENNLAIKTVSTLFNQCARDICGPAGQNKSVWLTNENFSNKISPDVLARVKEIDPIFKRLFRNAQKDRQRGYNELISFYSNAAKNLDSLPIDLQETMANDIFSPHVKVEVNPLAPLDQRINVTPKIPANASPELSSAIITYAKNLSVSLPLDARSAEFQIAFKDEDYLPLIKKYYSKIKETYDSNPALFPEHFKNKFKIVENSFANKFDKLRFDLAIIQLRAIDDGIANALKSKSIIRATCESADCKKVYQSILQSSQLTKSLDKYNEILSSSQNRTNAINKCKALVISQSLRASDEKKALEIFENSKKAIVANLLPRFSAHSRGIMQDYLENKLIASTIDIKKKITQAPDPVNLFVDSANYHLGFTPDLFGMPDTAKWKKLSSIYKQNGDIDPYSDLPPCSGVASAAWDAFLPVSTFDLKSPDLNSIKDLEPKDHVFISEHSCTNHSHGQHNTAHEIGHALNFLFKTTPLSTESLAAYKSIRQCANDYYPKLPLSTHPLSHESDKLYTEEDMADLFAIASNPSDKTIYSCQLIRPNITLDDYDHLSFVEIEDTHSTGLSRSILEMINKGLTLPQSCQNLIKDEAADLNLKKCL